MDRIDILGPELGNTPILAKAAFEVASGGGQRKGAGAGKVMKKRFFLDGIGIKKRFFLDGIGIERTGLGINQGVILPSAVLLVAACPPFSVGYFTFFRADTAFDFQLVQFFIKHNLREILFITLFRSRTEKGQAK
jgi:hypothetical protein